MRAIPCVQGKLVIGKDAYIAAAAAAIKTEKSTAPIHPTDGNYKSTLYLRKCLKATLSVSS
jgi:hypothetical protein